jgi:hypothetical protein
MMHGLLRKVARELRYSALIDIIGARVTIHSIETIQADLLRVLSPPIPATAVLDAQEPRFLIGALRKYGLMDLTLTVPEPVLMPMDVSGIPLLKHLGFMSEPESPEPNHAEDDPWEHDPTCLEELSRYQ